MSTDESKQNHPSSVRAMQAAHRAMPRLFPCGQSRREFVWEMGAGFAGVALSSLLGADGFFGRHRASE